MIYQSKDLPITQRSETMEGNRGRKIGNYSEAEEELRIETEAKEQRSWDIN